MRSKKRAVHLGDATLLAAFFWLGCALIFLYHAMWVVFLLTLISIWPFQTYTPEVAVRIFTLYWRLLRYRVAVMIALFMLLGAAWHNRT